MAENEPIESITSVSVPPASGAPRTCEYCGCKLTGKGEVLEMSAKARELRTLEDRLVAETAAHATTRGDAAALRTRIAELETQLAAAVPQAGGDSSQWGMR